MRPFPSVPRSEAAPDGLFAEGHLWILEYPDGAPFRFQLRSSGQFRFGDERRVYDSDGAPEPYRHAVEHVQTHLDRRALREAVADVESYVFFGYAMHRQTISYDWHRTPSVLGLAVYSAAEERLYPPDAVEGIFERLGLEPVNVFEREHRARDFDPDSYEIPASNWYDGPAAGVILRNKQGDRAKLLGPAVTDRSPGPSVEGRAADVVAEHATTRRFERLATRLEEQGTRPTFDRLYERVLEELTRELHRPLYEDGTVELRSFNDEVAARTREFLDERD